MLTPQQIEALADAVVDAYAAIDTRMRVEAAKGIAKSLDRSKVVAAIQRAGSPREIDAAITATYLAAAKTSAEADAGVYAVARAAGLISTRATVADEQALKAILAEAVATATQTHNLVLTSAVNAVSSEFTAALDKAMLEVATGAATSDDAIRRAVDTLARSQTRVTYVSSEGVLRSDTLYTAVRRNVVTGVNQATGRMVLSRAELYGCDHFEVSAHAGARPEHAAWQGQVYTLDQLYSVCGYGDVEGLEGANCRHSFSPFFPGVNTPTDYGYLDDLDNDTEYALSQEQRRGERMVRQYRSRAEIYRAGGDIAKAEAAELRAEGWYQVSANAAAQRRDFPRVNRMAPFPGESRWPD